MPHTNQQFKVFTMSATLTIFLNILKKEWKQYRLFNAPYKATVSSTIYVHFLR